MQQPVLIKGALTMDLNAYCVKKDGKEIELTAKEFEILKLLLQNPKKVYTKEQIYSLVWNDAYLGGRKCRECPYQQAEDEDRGRSP